MHRWFISGFSFMVFLLAACNMQPASPAAPTPDDTQPIEAQATISKRFGGALNTKPVNDPVIALDKAGFPVVAYSEYVTDSSSNLYVKRWNGSSWVQLGSALNVGSNVKTLTPTLALDNSGNPVVGWIESYRTGSLFSYDSKQIYVKRWNGNSWEELGSFADGLNHELPSLALDSSGNPIIVWMKYDIFSYSYSFSVVRWTGSNWVSVGSTLNRGRSEGTSLVLDSFGNPVFAASTQARGINIFRWDGSNWNVDENYAGGYKPSLVLDSSSNPVVSFDSTEFFNAWKSNNVAKVKRWNDSGLLGSDDGIILNTTEADAYPGGIGIDKYDNLVATIVENNNIYTQRWNGTAWVLMTDFVLKGIYARLALDSAGNPVVLSISPEGYIYVNGYYSNVFNEPTVPLDKVVTADATTPSIALDNNNQPVVAWREKGSSTDIYVARRVLRKGLAGWAWSKTPPADNVTGNNTYEPSLAVEKSTTKSAYNPVVAFSEDVAPNNRNVYVKRWNGTAWTDYGAALPLDMNARSYATGAKLALGRANLPYVSWIEALGSVQRLFVKRWNGKAWVRVGSGIEINGSNSIYNAALAVGTDNNPVVAWAEAGSGGNSDLYVKRWNGNTWNLIGTGALDNIQANYLDAPSIDIDSNNNPYVMWMEYTPANNSYDVYGKRWDGTIWRSVGTVDTNVGANALLPSLALSTTNTATVAYHETVNGSDNVYVKQLYYFLGRPRWRVVGSFALDTLLSNQASNPSLVLDVENKPVVAWQEYNYSDPASQNNIYVRRY